MLDYFPYMLRQGLQLPSVAACLRFLQPSVLCSDWKSTLVEIKWLTWPLKTTPFLAICGLVPHYYVTLSADKSSWIGYIFKQNTLCRAKQHMVWQTNIKELISWWIKYQASQEYLYLLSMAVNKRGRFGCKYWFNSKVQTSGDTLEEEGHIRIGWKWKGLSSSGIRFFRHTTPIKVNDSDGKLREGKEQLTIRSLPLDLSHMEV